MWKNVNRGKKTEKESKDILEIKAFDRSSVNWAW